MIYEYKKFDYQEIKYKLSISFFNALEPLVNLKYKDYKIGINKKTKDIIIEVYPRSYTGARRTIDVQNKTLTTYDRNQKTIDLSCIKEIYDELKHLELVALTSWLR